MTGKPPRPKIRGWNDYDPLEQKIRRGLNLGMENKQTFLKIEYIYGFELFGSYETWAGGFRLTDFKHRLQLESQHLDDVVSAWVALETAPLEEYEKKFSPAWLARNNFNLNHPVKTKHEDNDE